MNATSILEALRKGLALVDQFVPIASIVGGPIVQEVVNIAKSVLSVATNVKSRVEEGSVVFSTNDQEELDRIISLLQAENDRLAEYIAKS